MKIVVDASVVVKWILPDPRSDAENAREAPPEPHLDEALDLLRDIRTGKLTPCQPPHWLAEVAAVITRLRPEIAEEAVQILAAMELPEADGLRVYQRGVAIGRELRHHVFDTLYHAVAFEEDATLVTADKSYWRKAEGLGSVVRLEDFAAGSQSAPQSPKN